LRVRQGGVGLRDCCGSGSQCSNNHRRQQQELTMGELPAPVTWRNEAIFQEGFHNAKQ
jgi:hypothetical protein